MAGLQQVQIQSATLANTNQILSVKMQSYKRFQIQDDCSIKKEGL